VAGSARRRIVRGNVIRHGRSVGLRIGVIVLVTAVAVCGWESRRVVPADVAVRACVDHRPDRAGNRRARRQHVRTLQRESGCAVVELSIGPKNRIVAGRTHGSQKARSNVVRHAPADCSGALPRGLVAAVTVCVRGREVVIVVYVAVRAGVYFAGGRHLVRAEQRPAGRRVVKIHVQPRHGVMTIGARGDREYVGCSRMLRIVGLLPGGKVAARMPAVGRRNLQVEIIAHVATLAGNIRVPVCQREIDRRRSVVYSSSEPTVERVARLAGLRKVGLDVIRAGSPLKIRLVAGNARRRQPLELPDRCALMTVFALQRRMRP